MEKLKKENIELKIKIIKMASEIAELRKQTIYL